MEKNKADKEMEKIRRELKKMQLSEEDVRLAMDFFARAKERIDREGK